MQINLTKLAELESAMASQAAVKTNDLIFQALTAFYTTQEEDIEDLEPLFPIFQNLEELGVVTDAPELEEEIEEEGEDEGEEGEE